MNQRELLDSLNNKIKIPNCPFCGSRNFNLIEGFSRLDLSDNVNNIQIGGKNVPIISIACSNCGHIESFAVKAIIPDIDTQKGEL